MVMNSRAIPGRTAPGENGQALPALAPSSRKLPAAHNGQFTASSQASQRASSTPAADPAIIPPTSQLDPKSFLVQEARSLLTRLERVKSFAMHETMVLAAAPSLSAQTAIEQYMDYRLRELRDMVGIYLSWLGSPAGETAPESEAQRRFAFLRMRFNMILSHFDIFADVMTQRSEYQTGVWLAGLDAVAEDALDLPGYYDSPPVICYLDRGHGAAIRRARTRLPGGGENPVAIIRVPRERMVGSGIASSLIHEVGHQGAALLDLVNSLRQALKAKQGMPDGQNLVWHLYELWISEIVSDFWSASRVGIAAPMGLIGVVSLPRAFVFRVSMDDPHPIPWIRVKLSCAMGKGLYPHPQWDRLAATWESFYPLEGLDEKRRSLLNTLEAGIPSFVNLLLDHRPKALRGQSLGEVMAVRNRQPDRLRRRFDAWRNRELDLQEQPPALVFAMIGQARADGKITPEGESRLLADLLTHWALRSHLDASEICEAMRFLPKAKAV